eukprot:3882172-Karenia_brevis.AAC.1
MMTKVALGRLLLEVLLFEGRFWMCPGSAAFGKPLLEGRFRKSSGPAAFGRWLFEGRFCDS